MILATLRSLRLPSLSLVLAAACSSASGDEGSNRPHFHGESDVLPGFSGDTGLQPKGSDVQAQFVVSASGKVTADADATSGGSGSALIVVGTAGSGKLVVDGHFTLTGKLSIHITGLPGYDGPIPNLDGVDLKFGGTASFDPFLLGGKQASVVADIPETKLPDIPLPGGLTGKLVVTVVSGSTVTSTFHGVCAGVADSKVQYLGATSTSGKLLLKPTIVIKIPIKGDKSFDLPVVTVPIPARDVAMDLGTVAVLAGEAPVAGDASSTATAGACGGDGDGGIDGGGIDGATDSGTADGDPDTAHDTLGPDGGGSDSKADGGGGSAVTCGGAPCSAPSHYCCVHADRSESCNATGTTCDGAEIHCDDTSDCTSGVCCASPSTVAGTGSITLKMTCQPTCTGPYDAVMCMASDECSDASVCTGQICRGRPISTCGGLPPDVASFCG
jgi:hypothetical protein